MRRRSASAPAFGALFGASAEPCSPLNGPTAPYRSGDDQQQPVTADVVGAAESQRQQRPPFDLRRASWRSGVAHPLRAETAHAPVPVLAASPLMIGSKQESAALTAGYCNVAD
jgi:hypothetical protein